MGLFDYVRCSGPEFVCSEGHDLSDEEFQTKDLGCTMGRWSIDGALAGEDGGYGDPEPRPFLGRVHVYTSCSHCPAFVQRGTGNIVDAGVEFEVEIVDDRVRSIKRISQSTAEWLESTPQQSWMEGCLGPMSYAEAVLARQEIWRDRAKKEAP